MIPNFNAESLGVEKIGIVSCLNMLPYYHGIYTSPDDYIPLFKKFDSPSLLNKSLQENEIWWGCSSAINILENRIPLLFPCLGVGAYDEVESVYLEYKNTSAKIISEHEQSCILTTGASAQSLWLFEKILNNFYVSDRNSGFSKIQINKTDLSLSFNDICRNYQELIQRKKAFLLCIGDEALIRRIKFPAETRIDLAEAWQRHYQSPCIFALWGGKANHKGIDSEQKNKSSNQDIRRFLSNELEVWNTFSSAQKLQLAEQDLETRFSKELNQNDHEVIGSLDILNYFKRISWDLGAEEFQKTISTYLTIKGTS